MESLAMATVHFVVASKSRWRYPGLSRFVQADLCGDLCEMSAAVIVIHQRRRRLKDVRMAVGTITIAMLSAPYIVEVPLYIAQDDQIEKPVIVQIHPCRGGRPAAASGAGGLRHVGEGSIAVVVVKMIAAVAVT